jgi:hypothetical protein
LRPVRSVLVPTTDERYRRPMSTTLILR